MPRPQMIGLDTEAQAAEKMAAIAALLGTFRPIAAKTPMRPGTDPADAVMATECEAVFLAASALLVSVLNDFPGGATAKAAGNVFFQFGQAIGCAAADQDDEFAAMLLSMLSRGIREGAAASKVATEPKGSA